MIRGAETGQPEHLAVAQFGQPKASQADRAGAQHHVADEVGLRRVEVLAELRPAHRLGAEAAHELGGALQLDLGVGLLVLELLVINILYILWKF